MPLPTELKQLKQWIVWTEGKRPIAPLTGRGDNWQQPDSWVSFSDALRICKQDGYKGVGFVFRFPYVGIDLDDCIEEDGLMNALAREITNKIDTFTEYSRSGKGLHLYCKVTEPIKALKTAGIEVYGEGRYFIATGKELDAAQLEVTEQTANIKELCAKYGTTKTAAETVKAETFGEGERNNRMAAEIGRLYNFYDAGTVREMAHLINKRMCKPPLEDAELEAIIKSIGRREVHYRPARSMQQVDWEHVEGKRDLDATPYKGIAKQPGMYIPTGFPTLDYDMNDLAPGCTTLVAGRSNAGKSAVVRQIMANGIGYGAKCFAVLGEGDQETWINTLYRGVIGQTRKLYDEVKINKRWHKEPKAFALAALKRWHSGKLVLFNKSESKFGSMDDLFEMIDREITERGHNLVVIDNLMSVLSSSAAEKNEAQAKFMQACHDLAVVHRTHILLVLHPKKEYRPGEDFEMEQISGSSDLYNKADNVIAVIREYDPEKIRMGHNGKIMLLKNRYYSELPVCDTAFNPDTGLLHEIVKMDGRETPAPYDFDWVRYIDPKEAPPDVFKLIQGSMEDKQMREMGED